MRIVFIGSGEIGVPTLQALQKSAEHELKQSSPSRTNRWGAPSELSRHQSRR